MVFQKEKNVYDVVERGHAAFLLFPKSWEVCK